ncbi:MAG: hypothetical protein D6799_04675 [Bacteroidetes bacterium]|nr:MAG: hypothetical protein D6799_04675 [Bacteroidota bacterium]
MSNNYVYTRKVLNGEVYYETEHLNKKQKFNEYVYTRLRTIYGCNLDEIEQMFGVEYKKYFLRAYSRNKEYFYVNENGKVFRLKPQEGYLLADRITLDFICV